MMKKYFPLLLFGLISCSSNSNEEMETLPKANLLLGNEPFIVEIASTPKAQAKGLSKRNHINEKEGMIFVFNDNSVRYFWMKDTYIALDILFFDSNMKLITKYENVPPCKEFFCPNYSSLKPSKYVVELKGGMFKKLTELNKIKKDEDISFLIEEDRE